MLVLTFVISVIVLHFFLGNYVHKFLLGLHEELDFLFSTHPWVVLLIFQLLFIINHLLILPIHSLTCVALAMIVRKFFLAFVISTVFTLVASSLVYFFVQELFYDRIWKMYKENDLLNILLEESKKKPFQIALMARMMAIPVGLKDYLLALVHSPFPYYLLSAVISNCVFVSSAISIGIGLDNLEEVLEGKRPWSEKRLAEKLSFALFFAIIFFTSIVVFFITLWTKEKLRLRRARKEISMCSMTTTFDN